MRMDATLSSCGLYRYSLTRSWNGGAGRVLFIMLNPSTADALQDDPTIRRCVGFARSWGYEELEVVNLFAYRATDPDELARAMGRGVDIVGPDNDGVIVRAAEQAERRRVQGEIICAWGSQPIAEQGAKKIYKLLVGYTLKCLGRTKFASPKHPLYLSKDTPREIWRTS